MDWINTILQGLLLGGMYAIFATGLSLMFGIMRLVNIAHGDLIVLAAYLGLVIVDIGVHPFVALIIVTPIMGVIGYALQRGLLNRTLGHDILPPLLVTFGISIIIQNLLLEVFSADSRRLNPGALDVASIQINDQISIGVMPLIVFIISILIILALQFLFYKTEIGRAFRATSDDQDIARMMGISNKHIFGLAMAVAMAVVAIAGVLLAMRTNFDPAIGPSRLLFGFEAVIIGGLGSLWGTLAGGLILGIAQTVGAQIDPGWQILAGHIVFLIILVIRPRGLFPRSVD